MSPLKNKKFSLLHLIIFSILFSLITFGITSFWKNHQFNEQETASNSSYSCTYNVKRMNGFKFIKPLMFVDDECESEQLNGIKQKLTGIIEQYKTLGNVNMASVYLREYGHNEWTSVNEGEKYDPGSLFKVPVLITILKMNELRPGFLNKQVAFSKELNTGKKIYFPSKSIKLGQSYSIRELLDYMIRYSDNNATMLLESNMDAKVLQKLFSDIGLEVPNIYASEYKFTVKEYSYFMRSIYNAGYLSADDSEYAGELLSQCEFKEGIVNGLPKNTRVAHKFGEAGNQTEVQLHESAIVYLNNKPYLLTVMTKGKEMKKLTQLVSEISQAVYTDMLNEQNAML